MHKKLMAVAALALCSSMSFEANAKLDLWSKAPVNGATVSGVLSGGTCWSRGTEVARVQYFLDTTALNTDSNPGDGMNCELDTRKFPNGAYKLRGVARSASGATYTDIISIKIQNPTGPGLPAPTSGPLEIWFKAPLAGQPVSGRIEGNGCYVKGIGVARVEFFLDSTALNVDANVGDGMSCMLDTTKFADGAHTLKAVAFDSAGKRYEELLGVQIRNGSDEPPPSSDLPSTGVKATATFESLGLYWKPGSNPGAAGCPVQYRKVGESAWKQALPMWYDSRDAECRGSLVHLTPGAQYEVQLGLPGQAFSRGIVASTWSEQFPIARTVQVQSRSQMLNITEGGSPSGYVLYTPAPGAQATIDVANGADHNVRISAPYVIVRGFTMRGARTDAVRLYPGAHDVVIEDNDISGWGRYRGTAGGVQLGVIGDSAVRAVCSSSFNLERVVIQNNRLHDPRYGTNTWATGHPDGPIAISFSNNCAGNHVFRYNSIYSSSGHYFMDAMGGSANFSAAGFPNADTDIYGNRISNVYDDAIETEGANRNVRVWGNYIDDSYVALASTVTHTGPFYAFRNVYNRGSTFGKSGQKNGYGGGRRYFFHNTLLQSSSASADHGIKGTTGEPMTNSVSRNNVWHVSNAGGISIGVASGSLNDFNYDLANGGMTPYSGAERNGIVGTPIYAAGHGPASGAGGQYHLAPNSRGYDNGLRLPNFNDDFSGAGPDRGAHEAGSAAMRFGVR